MKEFVCFSSTNVFVSVSQLSTRDLFYFLEDLKIRQDNFVLKFYLLDRWSKSVMIPLFQIIFFGIKKNVQEKCGFSNYREFFKVNCGVDLGFLAHLSQKDVGWLTCGKKIITLNFRLCGFLNRKKTSFFCDYHAQASCRDQFKIDSHGFRVDVRWFMIESPVGCHVDWFKIKHLASGDKTHTFGHHVETI